MIEECMDLCPARRVIPPTPPPPPTHLEGWVLFLFVGEGVGLVRLAGGHVGAGA